MNPKYKSFKRGAIEGMFAVIVSWTIMFASYVDNVVYDFKNYTNRIVDKPAIVIEESAESKKLLEEFHKNKKEGAELAAQEKARSPIAVTSSDKPANPKNSSISSVQPALPKNDEDYSKNPVQEPQKQTAIPSKTGDRAPVPILPPQQIGGQTPFNVANILPSVVSLKCYKKDNFNAETKLESLSSGTGFFININGSDYIMAANHVVTDYENLGNFYGCFVYTDKSINAVYPYWAGEANQLFARTGYLASGLPAGGLDVALLKLTSPPPFLAKLINHTPKIENPPDILKKLKGSCPSANQYRHPIVGEALFTTGYFFSGGREVISVKDGVVSGKASFDPKQAIILGNPNGFSTNLNVDYGFSGSPVVSKDGCFVGIIDSATFGTLSYSSNIISSSDIMTFINSGEEQTTVGTSTSAMPAILRDTRRYLDINIIKLAVNYYLRDNDMLPQAISDLVPKYLPAEPKDPKSGYGYAYAFTRNKDSAHFGFDAEQFSKVIIVAYGDYSYLDIATYDDSKYSDDTDFNSAEDPANWYYGFNGDENSYLNNIKKETMTGCRLQYRAEEEIRYCVDKLLGVITVGGQSFRNESNLATIFEAIDRLINTWRKWVGVK